MKCWTIAILLGLATAVVGHSLAQTVAPLPNGTITVKIESPKPESSFAGSIKAVSEILVGLAWPVVVGIVLISQRRAIANLLAAATLFLNSSKRIKVGELIDIEADRNAREAQQQPIPSSEVPPQEVESAARISAYVDEAELPTVRARMQEFAREYENLRTAMAAGPVRTRAMNAVVAKMRTLALAAKPLLQEFASDESSPGFRLAAIVILQLSPNPQFLSWLAERMKKEQPFVFFHAAIALTSAVRAFGSIYRVELEATIKTALSQLRSFKGIPDSNTVQELESALEELAEKTTGARS